MNCPADEPDEPIDCAASGRHCSCFYWTNTSRGKPGNRCCECGAPRVSPKKETSAADDLDRILAVVDAALAYREAARAYVNDPQRTKMVNKKLEAARDAETALFAALDALRGEP